MPVAIVFGYAGDYLVLRKEFPMVLNIRNQEADRLARQLAEMDQTGLTEAVLVAIKEAIERRARAQSPHLATRKILEKHGLSFQPGRKPVPAAAYRDLDHDLDEGAGARGCSA